MIETCILGWQRIAHRHQSIYSEMKKLLIISLFGFFICWAAVAFIWIIFGVIACAFTDECIKNLNFGIIIIIVNSINIKSVFIRGTFMALVLVIPLWINFFKNK